MYGENSPTASSYTRPCRSSVRLREELPKWRDIWTGTTDDYQKAVHARRQYEETMGSIVWFNAIIGAFEAVQGDQ